MEKTKAVIFTKYGGPLSVGELKLPALKPKQILIKVSAASLNPVDYKRRDGGLKMLMKEHFPAAICFDCSGVVEQIGSEISKFAVGDRVCVRLRQSGSLAEYCIADEDVTAKMPDGVSFIDGAALPLAALTAYQCLLRGGLKEGESVFIAGGSGGVGNFAVQLAKHVFKAGRVVTTCSGGKADFCRGLGADEIVDYTKGNPYKAAQGPFDLVLDTVGDAAQMGGRLIKPGRFVVSIAALPDTEGFDRVGMPIPGLLRPVLAVGAMWNKWKTSPGVYSYVWMEPNAEHLQKLVNLVGDGTIKVNIDSTFEGMEKASDAFAKLESGHAKGKVVIVVRPEDK